MQYKNLLTQNAKMKKSSGVPIYNWTIPAIKTCPQALECKIGCYAASGTFMFKQAKAAHALKLELTKSTDFINLITSEIQRRGIQKVRIHDAGDFYSKQYLAKWLEIMKNCSNTTFYAYTKQVELFKNSVLPKNFIHIFSFGGRQDHLIDLKNDRNSMVFPSLTDLDTYKYSNTTDDDNIATIEKNIGLLYHGVKKYENTEWNQVFERFKVLYQKAFA